MSTPENKYVEIFRTSSAPQCEIIRLRLAEEGIPVFIDGELLASLAGELPFGWRNSPRIMVDSTRTEDAIKIIREILQNSQQQDSTLDKGTIFCLACQSPFDENAMICSRCGWSFEQEPVSTPTNTEAQPVAPTGPKEVEIPTKIRWLVRFIVAGVLAVVGFIGYKIFTDTEEEFENGLVALEKGYPDECIHWMTKVIRWDSKNANAYFYRSHAYYHKKQNAEALADINKAIQLETNPIYLDLRGEIYSVLHKYEEALTDFNTVIESKKGDDRTFHNRGHCYFMLKQYERAVQDYQQSLKLKPTSYHSRLNLAINYIRLGRWEEAIAEGNEARAMTNNNHLILNFLSYIYSSCSDAKYRNGPLALEYAKKACEASKNNPDYLDSLAAAYAEVGEFDLAVETQQKVLADKNFGAEDLDREKAIAKAKARLELYKNRKPSRVTPEEWE